MLVGRRGGRRAFAMVFTDLTAGRMDALIGNAWAVLSGRRVGENGMCWTSPSTLAPFGSWSAAAQR
jgi:hypothetical protein